MKKLMFVAVAALSAAAFAGNESGHAELTAKVDGFYDVTLTTKELAHATKTVTENFSTKRNGASAYDSFTNALVRIEEYAGSAILQLKVDGDEVDDLGEVDPLAKKISVKYSRYDYALKDKKAADVASNRSYKTKVVSKSNKGLYDANDGKVYLWDTSAKVAAPAEGALPESKNSGYVAYEVPLAMHGQFIATDDNKAAGGFTGGVNVAQDGTPLDFSGLTAFGTGTFDAKNGYVKTVSGNVASKDPVDAKFGCYGTWKLNKDTKADSLVGALVKKGCVELVLENK